MKSTKSYLLKGAFWIAVTRVIVGLTGTASTIVLARLLVPEDFGLVAIASAAAAIFAAISELSLSQALIQHEDPEEDHYHTAWSLNALRGLLLALVIAALGWPAAEAYGDPRLLGIMLGFALANLIGGFVNPKLAMFERRLEFCQWIVMSGGEKLAGFVVSATIAFVFRSYWALVAGVIASQLAKVVASYVLIHYWPKLRLSQIKDLLSFSVWMTLGQAVQALSWRADPLILGAFLPTRTIGQFSMGSRVATLAVGEILQPISQVLFPAFSRIRNDAERLRAAYLRSQGLMALTALPIGFGVASVAPQAVELFLGPAWLEAVLVVQLLAIAAALQRTNQLNALAMALGRTKSLFGRDLRALLVRLPLLLAGLSLAPQVEATALTGALVGHTLSSIVNSSLNMRLVSKISTITVVEQLVQVVRPLVSATGMIVVVTLLGNAVRFGDTLMAAVAELLACVFAGGATYVALMTLFWLARGKPGNTAEAEAVATLASLVKKVVGKRRKSA